MKITAVFDSSVSSAPAGYTTAIASAIQYLDALITTPLAITIQFGWGEVDGKPMSTGVGESLTPYSYFSYSQIRGALTASATSPDDLTSVKALPGIDPTNGGRFAVSEAEQVALGLSPSVSGPAGYIGLSSALNYTFDSNNRAVPGQYDAIGVLEHEITEVLGRAGSLGYLAGANVFRPLDLFRYSAAGFLNFSGPGSFSVDGGLHLLTQFNDPRQGGDAGDWVETLKGDSFGSAWSGTADVVSATDMRVLDVLGYSLYSPPSVTAHNLTMQLGQSIPASSLISVVSGSYPVSFYEFWDDTAAASSGFFTLGGVKQAAGQAIEVSASDLSKLQFTTGSAPGSDHVFAWAWDGQQWSEQRDLTITEVQPGGASSTELFHTTPANDTFVGLSGSGSVAFSGTASQYQVTRSGSSVIVADQVSGRDGTDTLSNIEHLKFSDYTIDTMMAARAAQLPSDTINHLVELYVAYFNRVPDATGLTYWINQVKNGESLTQVSKDFYAAGLQFSNLTGYSASMSDSDFITLIFKNVLGRSGATAPDASGIAYWENQIHSGATTREGLIAQILSDAHAFAGDPTWGWVPELLDNKIALGKYHAISLGLDYGSVGESYEKTVALVGLVTPTGYSSAVASIGLDSAVHLA